MNVDAELWKRYLAHATRARAKPTFDVEERDWKLPIADRLREALKVARDGGDWFPLVKGAFRAGLHSRLTVPAHRAWLESWATAHPESLSRGLAAFLDPDAQAEERFDLFASAAGDAATEGQIEPDSRAVLAVGSLFNFATEPLSLPIVRPWHFGRLEEIFGCDRPGLEPVSGAYAEHLAFARRLRAGMEESGFPVRDMVDVQSLIFIAAQEHGFWAGELYVAVGAAQPPEPDASTGRTSAPTYLSVCAIYRNEAPYIREWIEFHLLMGVERFFLYDNVSTDAHREALAPYVEDGLVTMHDWKVFPPDQKDTYEHCLVEHRRDSRWIAFVDLDEFLFSPTGRPLPDVLAAYEGWPGVGVNWAVFGTSGHRTKPPGLVIENYVMRIDHPANFIKSIVDPVRVTGCITPHHFAYDSLLTIDENHYPIHDMTSKSPSFSQLRINHYVTKSEEEARAKLDRAGNWRHLQPWRSEKLEDSFPEEIDRTITAHVPALRQALAATEARMPNPSPNPMR